MADRIIPTAILTWLIFLLVFILLGYTTGVSMLFGAIGGVAGGIVIGWWHIKGGAPSGPADRPPSDKLRRPDPNKEHFGAGWHVPFLKTNRANKRYMVRRKKARDRRTERVDR
ncbi:MAG: hypothetical protein DCF25_10025 [Leptolyngbya foveolarum]|uniref:Uncharacterized protein n=1 Tax=Leptolyngbya foveolarum TaxID=47253 RepID=A0A2W4UMP7_9CYAN|nr:MAG: hypothetical protein DCF25_10025 [Leptolyngbya foveolarum]